jgi:hypothetical protein
LTPTGSSAKLDQTSWANGSEAAPILNLGTFNPALGNTLTLTGGSLLTFKNGGSDVTGAFLDFRTFQPVGSPSGAFTEFGLPFMKIMSLGPAVISAGRPKLRYLIF